MVLSSPQGLRQRKVADDGSEDSGARFKAECGQSEKTRQAHEEVVWGQTPDGEGGR